ncbi:MAG: hypothetical protein U9N00_04570 [Candidatus Bipolaricaulota bacterium]|nr:hypothetical protein [Candidatus Bipolaricaulota bacterium]
MSPFGLIMSVVSLNGLWQWYNALVDSSRDHVIELQPFHSMHGSKAYAWCFPIFCRASSNSANLVARGPQSPFVLDQQIVCSRYNANGSLGASLFEKRRDVRVDGLHLIGKCIMYSHNGARAVQKGFVAALIILTPI